MIKILTESMRYQPQKSLADQGLFYMKTTPQNWLDLEG